MQTAQRLTARERNAAMERLRTLTTAVTLAGFTATFGFAVAAAVSHPGTQASTVVSSTTSGSGSSSVSSNGSTLNDALGSTTIGSSIFGGSSGSHAITGGS